MDETHPSRPLVIYLSLTLGMMLNIIPIPVWLDIWRPEWLAMALAYWIMALPRRVGLGWAWIFGLLMDVLQGNPLGQHCIGYILIAYIITCWHQRIRIFPLWQQAITIGGVLTLNFLLQLWVHSISGNQINSWTYWSPILTSIILWPWMFISLRLLRRNAHLN